MLGGQQDLKLCPGRVGPGPTNGLLEESKLMADKTVHGPRLAGLLGSDAC